MIRGHPTCAEMTGYSKTENRTLCAELNRTPPLPQKADSICGTFTLSVATEFKPTINHQIPYADTVITRYVSPSGWIRAADAGSIPP